MPYWLELMSAAGLVPQVSTAALSKEADEIVAMTGASIRTLRTRSANPKSKIQNPK